MLFGIENIRRGIFCINGILTIKYGVRCRSFKKKGNSGYRQPAKQTYRKGHAGRNRTLSLFSRKVCVNGPGGLLAGAHGEDHRGGAGNGYSVITIQFFFYAAIFNVTCIPAFVTSVISISRLNFSHLPVVKSETRD